MFIDIGELADRTGIPTSALRYYEQLGLIQSVGRKGLRRQFGPEAINQIALIDLGRAAGFTLKEISNMGVGGSNINVDRKKVSAKADELEAQLKRLSAYASILRHVAECPEENHLACKQFQKLMNLAKRSRTIGKLGT